MHVRIHVQILHALRDSIVRLTLVKLTCPPSEEVNSLNGKECLSSTLWWHPLFPSVTLWEIITQVHSCLLKTEFEQPWWQRGWGEALQTAYNNISKRAQMCRARHILAHHWRCTVSHISYTQVDKKRGNEERIQWRHKWIQRMVLAENKKKNVLINTREESQRREPGWVVCTYFLMGIRPSGLSCSFNRVYLY